jgi:hypothetical protein
MKNNKYSLVTRSHYLTYWLVIFPTPICLGWGVHNLYTQHILSWTHIFRSVPRSSYRSQQDLLWSFGSSQMSQITGRMNRSTLSQGYLINHISTWSSSSDHPPSLKENQLLVDHTSVYQVIFLTEQPIGASSLSSYPGQTSCLPVSGTFLREVTKPLYRKQDAASCDKRLAKCLCGSPTRTAFSLTWKISLPQLPPVYTCQEQCCI